jgi:maltose alpha-D-glucosyltransferase/alpha-amylase
VSLFDHAHSEADKRGKHQIVLVPYGYLWYRMGGLGYLLDRREA